MQTMKNKSRSSLHKLIQGFKAILILNNFLVSLSG
jgi:hypothetical protein